MENILAEKKNRILNIEIRTPVPGKNYISLGLVNEIYSIIKDQDYNDIDIVIFKGNKKVFSLGAAIFEHIDDGTDKIKDLIDKGNQVFDMISSIPVATVAAIQGYALGGGFELALSCDFILLSNRAKIGLVESNIGILPGWGGFLKLSRRVGTNRAFEMVLSGRIIDAGHALEIGAVNYVYDKKEFETKTDEFCESIISKGNPAIRSIKSLYKYLNQRDAQYFANEQAEFLGLWNEGSRKKIKNIVEGAEI